MQCPAMAKGGKMGMLLADQQNLSTQKLHNKALVVQGFLSSCGMIILLEISLHETLQIAGVTNLLLSKIQRDNIIHWFSVGAILPPRVMSRDISDVTTKEEGCYWRLVSRGQGCCRTSYTAQESCPPAPCQRIIQPNYLISVSLLRNSGLSNVTETHLLLRKILYWKKNLVLENVDFIF